MPSTRAAATSADVISPMLRATPQVRERSSSWNATRTPSARQVDVGLEVAVSDRHRMLEGGHRVLRRELGFRRDARTRSVPASRDRDACPPRQSRSSRRCVSHNDDSDAAAGSLPVLVLQQSLVELAGGMAGEFLAEVDRAGHFTSASLASAELDQFRRRASERLPRRRASRGGGRPP